VAVVAAVVALLTQSVAVPLEYALSSTFTAMFAVPLILVLMIE
jgi:hypothetical protein